MKQEEFEEIILKYCTKEEHPKMPGVFTFVPFRGYKRINFKINKGKLERTNYLEALASSREAA